MPARDRAPGEGGVTRGLDVDGVTRGLVVDGVTRGLDVDGAAGGLVVDGAAGGLVVDGAASGLVVDGAASGLVVDGEPVAARRASRQTCCRTRSASRCPWRSRARRRCACLRRQMTRHFAEHTFGLATRRSAWK
jgi:hypothetical protein